MTIIIDPILISMITIIADGLATNAGIGFNERLHTHPHPCCRTDALNCAQSPVLTMAAYTTMNWWRPCCG